MFGEKYNFSLFEPGSLPDISYWAKEIDLIISGYDTYDTEDGIGSGEGSGMIATNSRRKRQTLIMPLQFLIFAPNNTRTMPGDLQQEIRRVTTAVLVEDTPKVYGRN